MNYEVSEKKGESLRVGLRELVEGQYEITIDGHTVHVDAVKTGRTIYSMIEDGKQFEAVVDEQGAHGFDVLLGGRLYHLQAVDERTQRLAAVVSVVATGPQAVAAEMAGKVVKLSATVGDEVSKGQGVVIVEAMKMENEIPSPIDGVLKELAVTEGQTVEAGALLFVVESPAEE